MSAIIAIACFIASVLIDLLGETLIGALHLIAGSIFYLAFMIERK